MTDQLTARGPDNDLVLGEFTDRKTLRFVRDFTHAPETVWATLIDREQYRVWLWPCSEFEARLDGDSASTSAVRSGAGASPSSNLRGG